MFVEACLDFPEEDINFINEGNVNKKLENLGYKFNVIVNLDITSPFIRTKDIKGALSLLKKKKCVNLKN